MKKKLTQVFKVRGETVEVFLVPDEYETKAGYGKPYPELQEEKRKITLDQDKKDKRELHHENLKEMLKHHEDAVRNVKAEIAALEKDMKEDEGDIRREADAAEKTKKQWDKIDKKELKKDTKKEKEEHEEDAIEDDKSKIKKLQKGKPSEKKSAEKKALKRDMKFDKDSKKKMEGEKIKPKKSYAQMLMDIAAERFGGKKRSALKDSDFLDPKRRSFPVMSAQDVKDAVSSWGRYKGSMTFDEFKAKLTRRAKKIGAESALPKSWSEKK
jgi:chromosome segregation ATPase